MSSYNKLITQPHTIGEALLANHLADAGKGLFNTIHSDAGKNLMTDEEIATLRKAGALTHTLAKRLIFTINTRKA